VYNAFDSDPCYIVAIYFGSNTQIYEISGMKGPSLGLNEIADSGTFNIPCQNGRFQKIKALFFKGLLFTVDFFINISDISYMKYIVKENLPSALIHLVKKP
jgi:hypothetical protein